MSSEMWIYLLDAAITGYFRERTRQDPIPAHKLGLMTDAEGEQCKKKVGNRCH